MGSLISLLQQRAYRRLWVARTVSQWGDAFNTVALVLLVYSRTGSGVGVSGVVVAEIAPVLLLAPLAGAVVDRISRVRVMVAADLSRAALVFALPFFDGQLSAVYATAFALAAGAVFFNPAAQSVLPSIVRERDLVAANSGLWSAAVVSQIVLAPLAGIVVATYGYAWAFWLNAASYLVSAVALRRLHLRATPASTTSASWYLDARAGIAVLARHQLLRALAAAQLLAALSAGATSALLVVLSAEQLDLTAGDYRPPARRDRGRCRCGPACTVEADRRPPPAGVRPGSLRRAGGRRCHPGHGDRAGARPGGTRRLRRRHLDRCGHLQLHSPGRGA